MADTSVTERRLRSIEDFLSAGKLPQALKECQKWEKKGEKSDRFLALKGAVLLQHQDPNHYLKGGEELRQLCYRVPPVTNLDAITTIKKALKAKGLEEYGSRDLYKRAANASKTADTTLLMAWLHDCTSEGRYQDANTAVAALRKAFPSERKYYFWTILMNFLTQKDTKTAEKDRETYGKLAYALVSKSAQSMTAEQVRTQTRKETALTDAFQAQANTQAITTPEELSLLVEIYIANGHAFEAAKLLWFIWGAKTHIVRDKDPDLVTALLFDAYHASEEWSEAVGVCQNLLDLKQKACKDPDDRIWNLLVEAAEKGASPTQQNAIQTLQSHTLRSGPNRSALVAAMRASQMQTQKLCETYYNAHKTRPFAFQDLYPALSALPPAQRESFLRYVEDDVRAGGGLTERTLVLKVKRLTRSPSPAHHLEHAAQALKLYGDAIRGDPEEATAKELPELALLAAISLVNCAHACCSPNILYRALALAHLTYKKYKEYFPNTLLLIELCRHFGFFSLAMSTYAGLSVKNLQLETVSHHLFTRISTLHPHKPTGLSTSADGPEGETLLAPFDAVKSAWRLNVRVEEGLADSIKKGLREGAYTNIVNAAATRASVNTSIGTAIYLIEERRLVRMTDCGNPEVVHLSQFRSLEDLRDLRDFSIVPANSAEDRASWDKLSCGPVPGKQWLAVMYFCENLRSYLRQGSGTAGTGSAMLEKAHGWAVKTSEKPSHESELTTQEQKMERLTHSIYNIITGEYTPTKAKELARFFEAGWLHLYQHSPWSWFSFRAPWSVLHGCYTAYEAASLVLTFANWVDRSRAGLAKGYEIQRKLKSKGAAEAKQMAEDLKSFAAKLPDEPMMVKLRQAAHELADTVKLQTREEEHRRSQWSLLDWFIDIVRGTQPSRTAESIASLPPRDEEFETAFESFLDLMGGDTALELAVGEWLESIDDSLAGVMAVDVERGTGLA
ncbi:uncharacterized protein AB675_463 [Cyphellophora attinorum]|uniref:N-terminal acetyltransferase B complex subunit MDM20 n=1 Tax=Cyphellophora attinorum TaxID=1664694 RepID=A0A0N0NRW0_9EURO|nr:uncharacterized protein AB675_463 [Phialophora attinorum]KPI45548.1 hypothetical protein AB675_463 [Phialophora attinorum]